MVGRAGDVERCRPSVCVCVCVCVCRQNVLLRFESFELESALSDATCYDAVTVYDGADAEAPIVGSYCGTEPPADILASTNHLYVVFQTDSADTAAGFRAHYSAKHGSGAVDGQNRYHDIDDKKLSYRRGTARCVVSVEILPIATQQCRNYLYDKS